MLMPAYKLNQLGDVLEALLFEEYLYGNLNWVPDFQVKRLAWNKRNILEKEDTWRRVADDLVKLGRIKKLKGKTLYKHRYCPDGKMVGKVVAR